MKFLKILLVICIFLIGCTTTTTITTDSPSIGNEIIIPDGYIFIGASSYGKYFESTTIYCKNIDTNEYYICTNGEIGKKIIIPDGYELVDVSAYGQFVNGRLFYCKLKDTERIFRCKAILQ